MAAGQREDHRVAALELAEPADGTSAVGQRVVRKDAAGDEIGTRGMTASHMKVRGRDRAMLMPPLPQRYEADHDS